MIQDRYEDRLLDELRALVAESAERAPAAARRPLLPRRLAVAGAAGGACVAAAGFALAGGDRGSTAYAVEPHDDGTVTIEISELRDPDGLERTLAEQGIAAEVDYLPPGKVCREPRFTPAGRAPFHGIRPPSDGSYRLTVDKAHLRPGETLVITSMTPADRELRAMAESIVKWGLAAGEVAPCDPVDGTVLRRVTE